MNWLLRATVMLAAFVSVMPSEAASERGINSNTTAINESRYVRIGGIDQWLQIRGDDRANPVLLWLNGGPGSSTIASTYLYRPWERHFTVVMWDQRGEGRTFEKSGEAGAGAMTIDQMSSDGIEVAQYLQKHLHKKNIILLGHSWGSILGIHMVVRRPELFAAYVGTGQVINLHRQFEAAYPRLLERTSMNPEATKELKAIGPPPWRDDEAYKIMNKWAAELEPPERTTPPMPAPPNAQPPPAYILAGVQFSGRALYDAIGNEDVARFSTRFAVPMVFIQGSDDLLTTTSMVKAYSETIEAPEKRFIELPAAGHLAIFRDPDAFLAQLVAQVRPLATNDHR
jgi:pimeloyl-ACP methyl ester carboxylesterase